MKAKNTFIQGKLNKDIDERLIPKGQYPHAENVRVSNSDGSDIGAVENMKGNEQITSLGLTNAQCIGAYEDGSRNDIYWFIAGQNKDLVVKYNTINDTTNILLESDANTGVLNFNPSHLITGVNLVVNTDDENDLLFWTDNLNPPRVINVKRFIGSAPDSFTEEDISVIKKPPTDAPVAGFVSDPNSLTNTINDLFLSFGYRYKYADGEYSALSSFTYYMFSPNGLDIDFFTTNNEGMQNSFNAVLLTFNTGSKNVTDIELVFKRSNSNNVYVIESFNKKEENWSDGVDEQYTFKNNKTYKILPDDELLRSYDNVPHLAQAQEIIGSRIVYGNYVEGFDIKNSNGEDIDINFSLDIVSEDIFEVELPVTINTDGNLEVDVSDMPLNQGSQINFKLSLDGTSPENSGGTFEGILGFILNETYSTKTELFNSIAFQDFIDTYSVKFETEQVLTPPVNGLVDSTFTGFTHSYSNDVLTITTPFTDYLIDNTPDDSDISDGDTSNTIYGWEFNSQTTVLSTIQNASTSLKTNRNYEAYLVYLDEYGRKSTALPCPTNTINVPQSSSDKKNRLKVIINNEAPTGINRYKVAVKQNRAPHYNIFATEYFIDGPFVWVKLEGSNKNKVNEGDVLIVKSDSSGLLNNPVETTVLEVNSKERDFIVNNRYDPNTGEIFISEDDTVGEAIVEPAGTYMKIKPSGYNMLYTAETFFDEQYFRNFDLPLNPYVKVDAIRDNGVTTSNFPINQNAIVKLKITALTERRPERLSYEKEYQASQDYANFEEFYLGEEGIPTNNEIDIPDSTRVFRVYDSSAGTIPIGESFLSDATVTVDPTEPAIYFVSPLAGDGSRRTSNINVEISIRNSNGLVVFETKPPIVDNSIAYETSETFDIIDGEHQGDVNQDLVAGINAEVTLDFFNTYNLGSGVESNYYLDGFNKEYLNIDLRPTSTSVEDFKAIRRYSNLTYSEPYNEETNVNGLNEFNLARANYKDDLNKKEGSIYKLYAKDTDLLVFQEDKVSKVLYNKSVIFNADGSSNVSSIQNVLGQHVSYAGEFGISKHPEGFTVYGNTICFPDQKRGAYIKLGGEGIFEISNIGMRNYFRDAFRINPNEAKLGGYDPFNDQYLFRIGNKVLVYDDKNKGWTTILTYNPEFMIGMNNRFYSFKNGELYLHDSEQVNRNTFYGVTYPSKISAMVNEKPSDVKQLKAVSIEGNHPWDVGIDAYLNDTSTPIVSSLNKEDFNRKEGMWYAYVRRNESALHEDSKSMYGIGSVTGITGTTATVNGYSSTLTVGDVILKGSDLSAIGIVQSVTPDGNTTDIELSFVTGLSNGDFIVGVKNARIEGGYLRGYTMKLNLELTETDKVELFAVNSEVMKSFS